MLLRKFFFPAIAIHEYCMNVWLFSFYGPSVIFFNNNATKSLCVSHTSDFRLLGSLWGARFPKMGDSLPRTPMNHRAKFDAAALSSRDRSVTVQTHTHTKQTVNDISTPCLPACVSKKYVLGCLLPINRQ